MGLFGLTPLGLFLIAIGMFIKEFYKNNPSSVDVFGLTTGIILVGAACSLIGIVSWAKKL